MREVIIAIVNAVHPEELLEFTPGYPQMAMLVLADAQTGAKRRVMTTLDHNAKHYIVVDAPEVGIPATEKA